MDPFLLAILDGHSALDIGTRFRRAVETYATSNGIPRVRFGKADRKIDVMQPQLQAKARAVNSRILNAERAGQATVLASPAFERIAHPSTDADGRRTPALRFGDPRVMALAR